jgi:hypothetical protein
LSGSNAFELLVIQGSVPSSIAQRALGLAEQGQPGVPLRSPLLELGYSGGAVTPKTGGGPLHSTGSVTHGVS